MKTMKRIVLAMVALMAMYAGAAQAVISEFTYTGGFVLYDGTDPVNMAVFGGGSTYGGALGTGEYSAGGLIDSGGNGYLGDAISGTMSLDFAAGTGSATIVPGDTFFGSPWSAVVTDMTLGYTEAGYTPLAAATNWHSTILFDWNGNGNIHVNVDWDIHDDGFGNYTFATVGSWMFDGPFVTAQPTFYGTLTAVPVPATAWMVGSGLLGLLGVGRARRKTQLAA